ncbi:MAG: molybdopterin-dependent oxidoreductase [Bacillus subtilis]|nr:molybdopterin-dependent oxidoreductase [Bacillus subtilis]
MNDINDRSFGATPTDRRIVRPRRLRGRPRRSQASCTRETVRSHDAPTPPSKKSTCRRCRSGYFTVDCIPTSPARTSSRSSYDDLPFFADRRRSPHRRTDPARLLDPTRRFVDERQSENRSSPTPDWNRHVFDWTDSVVIAGVSERRSRNRVFEPPREIDTKRPSRPDTRNRPTSNRKAMRRAIPKPRRQSSPLIGSIQCPYYVKNAVHPGAWLPATNQVRVIQPAVGGAFGGKEEYPSIIACPGRRRGPKDRSSRSV